VSWDEAVRKWHPARGMAVDSPSDIGVVKVAPRSIMKRIRMRVEKFSVHLKEIGSNPVGCGTYVPQRETGWPCGSGPHSIRASVINEGDSLKFARMARVTAKQLSDCAAPAPVDLCGARASVVDGPCRSLWSIVLRDAGLPPNWSWRAAVATRGNATRRRRPTTIRSHGSGRLFG
jgi:hypothetical protein